MEKRTLIALALSFLVLGFYPVILEKIYPDYYKKSAHKKSESSSATSKLQTVGSDSKIEQAGVLTGAQVFSPAADLPIQTSKLNLVFGSESASLREVSFKEFINHKTKKALNFFSLTGLEGAPLSISVNSDVIKNFSVSQNQSAIEAVAQKGGLKISKILTPSFSGYDAVYKVIIENISQEEKTVEYLLGVGPSVPQRNSIDAQYIEANFFNRSEGKIQHVRESGAGKRVRSKGVIDWAAIKDRHFSIIIKPKTDAGFSGVLDGLGDHRFAAYIVSPKITLPAMGKMEHEFLVYIGPNEIETLSPLGLDAIVNFGKLDMIGKLLVGGLELLNKIFKNYGVAIIVLTILTNVLLFPMTRISYMSMKRMQLIQPQMTKLREQLKNSPEKLNREMMELYKKHKVNPFGGCLPMILQMPIFIALYVALSKSVILMNAKFLWVKDLSSPDDVPIPFSLPFLGNEIHILPLIMVAGMVIQQKFSQIKMEGQDPAIEQQQKMMAIMMPIIFGFIFYTMPSGLVLYWLTNTIFMTAYQLSLKNVTLT